MHIGLLILILIICLSFQDFINKPSFFVGGASRHDVAQGGLGIFTTTYFYWKLLFEIMPIHYTYHKTPNRRAAVIDTDPQAPDQKKMKRVT